MIKIRAHHLLCIPRFYGGGYDRAFGKNMRSICMKIRRNPRVRIRAVAGEPDDLCARCPHRHERGCVQSEEIGRWVVSQDEKVANYLGLKPGSVHAAKDVLNLSMDKVNGKTIRSVCKGCIFLDNCVRVGINSSFRKDLNRKL
jgi:hypothetical protein